MEIQRSYPVLQRVEFLQYWPVHVMTRQPVAGLVNRMGIELHQARLLDHLHDYRPVIPSPRQIGDPNIDQGNLLGLRLGLGTYQNHQREPLNPRLGIVDCERRIFARHEDRQVDSSHLCHPNCSEKGRDHQYWRNLKIEVVAVVSRLPGASLPKKL